ncbi:hypothetical protein K1W54_32950 [Micromonospora sp. CPCC 205371]|nr:hypothetical protein [Micromonospora sp. CPCC 205371]
MYALKHPWFTAVAGLGIALGLVAALDTSAPALRLASDAVVMPSAAPLPETPVEPATTSALPGSASGSALSGSARSGSGLSGEAEGSSTSTAPDEGSSTGTVPDEASSSGTVSDEGSSTGSADPDVAEAPMVGPVQPGREREPEPEPEEQVTTGGVLLVPSDIQPGTYQGIVPEDSTYCYWTRLSGTSGEPDDIIAGDFLKPGERVTVTISEGDAAFAHSGCGTLTR